MLVEINIVETNTTATTNQHPVAKQTNKQKNKTIATKQYSRFLLHIAFDISL